jgi:hypothetical protein
MCNLVICVAVDCKDACCICEHSKPHQPHYCLRTGSCEPLTGDGRSVRCVPHIEQARKELEGKP